jgi:hypothetical protein
VFLAVFHVAFPAVFLRRRCVPLFPCCVLSATGDAVNDSRLLMLFGVLLACASVLGIAVFRCAALRMSSALRCVGGNVAPVGDLSTLMVSSSIIRL